MKTFADLWVTLTPQQKQALARKVDSSVPYLSQIAHGHRTPSLAMVRKLARASRKVRSEMFF